MMSATFANPSVRSRCSAAVGEKCASGSSPSTSPAREDSALRARRARPARAPGSGRAASRRAGARAAPRSAADGARRSPRASAAAAPPSGRRGRGCPSRARPRCRPTSFSPGFSCLPVWPVASSSASPVIVCLLVAARDRRSTAPDSSERLDELVQPVAVPLLERRALRLPVVREHDDQVRAAARTGAPGRSGRTAGRACAAPRACRRARGRSGARPRRSSRTSRRRRAGRASCP